MSIIKSLRSTGSKCGHYINRRSGKPETPYLPCDPGSSACTSSLPVHSILLPLIVQLQTFVLERATTNPQCSLWLYYSLLSPELWLHHCQIAIQFGVKPTSTLCSPSGTPTPTRIGSTTLHCTRGRRLLRVLCYQNLTAQPVVERRGPAMSYSMLAARAHLHGNLR